MTTPQGMLELADDLDFLATMLSKKNTKSDAGFDKKCIRAAEIIRQAAAPQGREALRWCGYCETWNCKPCGEQCHWLPTDPTLEQMSALTPAVAPDGAGEAWRCFHCDDVFTDKDAAREHFGDHLQGDPACKLNAMEGGLLKLVRDQEEELQQRRQEDTASYREFYSLGSDHARALQREEEKGYARGLADGRALAQAQQPGEERMSGAYTDQAIFDAIAAATYVDNGGIAVRVAKFIEVFNNHRDRALCTSLALPPPQVDSGREQIAAFLLARDEADVNVPVPHGLILWARNLLANGMDAVHSGDCTKESHSCVRCTADRALRDADAILALRPGRNAI